MCTYVQAAAAVVNLINTAIQVHEIKVERAESKYNAEVMMQEAKQAKTQAAEERQDGIEDARKQRLNAILNIAERKGDIAASNLDVNSQTALNIYDDEKLNGEINALTTIRNANKRSDAYLQTANKYFREAELTSFKGKRKERKAYAGMIGDTLKNMFGEE